jgi:hypothetical protein
MNPSARRINVSMIAGLGGLLAVLSAIGIYVNADVKPTN